MALATHFAALQISQGAVAATAALPIPAAHNARERAITACFLAHTPLIPQLAASIFSYTLPPLRQDFTLYGHCSNETLADLPIEGPALTSIDLSGIVLGKRNPRCADAEFADHVDTDSVHSCLSDANPAPFTALLALCPNVTSLTLADCNLNDAVVAAIPTHLPRLQSLDLSGNRAMSFVGMQHIQRLTQLHTLCLRNMAKGRTDEHSNICFFGLSHETSQREETRGIRVIKHLQHLRTLDLSENFLDGGTTFLDTELRLESCLPELITCMGAIRTLERIILNDCSDLFLEQIEDLRRQRPRATIEIISNAVPLETALANNTNKG